MTVEHLDAYDTLYYTADDCSYNQLSIIDSAMIECTTPSGAGMGTEFVMASRGGGLAQSVQGSGVSCVPDANGAITVRVNHQFRYFEYTDPQTGNVSYVPYGKPLAAGTASWCNYATGTEFEYSNPPVDLGTPCQLFTPSTQSGFRVSRVAAITFDECSGSVVSTTESRLAAATATTTTTTTVTAGGVCSHTATFGTPARPLARPLARRPPVANALFSRRHEAGRRRGAGRLQRVRCRLVRGWSLCH